MKRVQEAQQPPTLCVGEWALRFCKSTSFPSDSAIFSRNPAFQSFADAAFPPLQLRISPNPQPQPAGLPLPEIPLPFHHPQNYITHLPPLFLNQSFFAVVAAAQFNSNVGLQGLRRSP